MLCQPSAAVGYLELLILISITLKFRIIGAMDCPSPGAVSFVRISRAGLTALSVSSSANTDSLTCAKKCQANQAVEEGGLMACASFNFDASSEACQFFDDAVTPAGSGVLTSDPNPDLFYYEKICLPSLPSHPKCHQRTHSFERIRNSRLDGFVRKTMSAGSREECLDTCLFMTDFICLSANYNYNSLQCELSDQDRRSKPQHMRTASGSPTDYFENNCLDRQTRCGEMGGNLIYIQTTQFEIRDYDQMKVTATSESYCLQYCLDSTEMFCRSVEFNEADSECFVSDEDTFSRADGQGKPEGGVKKNYYEPICVASDLSSSTCRQQAAFTRYLGTALQSTPPIASAQQVTVADCISLCFQNLDCKSVNYDRPKQTCSIFAVKRGDEGALVGTDPAQDYFEFNCESQFGGIALCTDQGIKFIVNTKEPYTGAVYAAERYSTCRQEVTNSRQITMVFPPPTISTQCGTALRNGRLEADVVVSLDGVLPHQVTTEWDRFYRVSCDTTLQGIGEGSVVVTTLFDTTDLQVRTINPGTPGPVTASLMFLNTNNEMVLTTSIGQQLLLVAKSPQAGPSNMMLMDCTASRAGGSGTNVPFRVIDNGCPTYPSLVGPVVRDHTHNRLAANMKAFRLDGSFDIQMTCTVMFCAGANGCPPSNCLDAATYKIFQSYGRKKRSLEDNSIMENEITEESLTAFIRVLAEGEEIPEGEEGYIEHLQRSQNIIQLESQSIDDMMCIDESSFIAIIVTVSLLCVLFSGVIVAWGCSRLRQGGTLIHPFMGSNWLGGGGVGAGTGMGDGRTLTGTDGGLTASHFDFASTTAPSIIGGGMMHQLGDDTMKSRTTLTPHAQMLIS